MSRDHHLFGRLGEKAENLGELTHKEIGAIAGGTFALFGLAFVAFGGGTALAAEPGATADSNAASVAVVAPSETALVDGSERSALSSISGSLQTVTAGRSLASPSTTAAAVKATPKPKPKVKPKPKDPSHTYSGWYTPVRHYNFTAVFGQPGPWASGYHTGLDFATGEGSPIRAVTNGVVVSAGDGGAYGNLLQIKVGKHTEVWTAHMQSFAVSVGDHIKAGETVGYVGMTGHTTGPHCHMEVRVDGVVQNPTHWLWPDGGIRSSL